MCVTALNDFAGRAACGRADDEPIFRALADSTRRGLLDDLRLRDGQRPAELSARYQLSRQAVLRHLTVLEDAALVIAERRRGRTLYRLNRVVFCRLHTDWIARFAPVCAAFDGVGEPQSGRPSG